MMVLQSLGGNKAGVDLAKSVSLFRDQVFTLNQV